MSEKKNCFVCLEICETSMYTSMLLSYFIFVQRTWHPKASNNPFMSSRINEARRTMDFHPVPSIIPSTCSHHLLPQLPLVSYTCTAGKVTADAGAASEQHTYWLTGQHPLWLGHCLLPLKIEVFIQLEALICVTFPYSAFNLKELLCSYKCIKDLYSFVSSSWCHAEDSKKSRRIGQINRCSQKRFVPLGN